LAGGYNLQAGFDENHAQYVELAVWLQGMTVVLEAELGRDENRK
jgi:hypothetical protein